jgi:N-acetylmuramidase/Putative peptidoglycan binding domain
MKTEFTGKSSPLSQAGLVAAADSISVKPEELWTVIAVETSGCGFLPDRRPPILFERHVFHRLTGGRFSQSPVSNLSPGGYGASGASQYNRLASAIALDRTAALKSTSWGLGQIMGENFAMTGCPDVETMVFEMTDSEDAQLKAVATFIGKSKLSAPLQQHDWRAFASRYNGPTYAKNQYDVKLAAAYGKFSSGAMPDLTLRAVQLYLTFLGSKTGGIDGIDGPRTRAAISAFQRTHGLAETGAADDNLILALRTALEDRA